MDKIQKRMVWAVVMSESIHVFCCFLPTVFSVVSLLMGAGILASMPHVLEIAHGMIHAYEIPVIIFSAFMLVVGWCLYGYSRRINCRTDGACCHQPCAPKKDRVKQMMMAATVLFVVNVIVYFSFHHADDETIVRIEASQHAH